MRHLLSLALLGMFGFAIIGCESSPKDSPDTTPPGTSTTYKKTTVKEPDGTVKTESRTERNP